jgi:hypothetical protein
MPFVKYVSEGRKLSDVKIAASVNKGEYEERQG